MLAILRHETRRQRAEFAALVIAGHLLLLWLWMSLQFGPRINDPVPALAPVYAKFIDVPRPQPLGTPAPVKVTLLPVTQPKLPTPRLQPIEVDLLASPATGPDPAPSSSAVTRPGPGNSGVQGYPVTQNNQGLKLVRRVAPTIPSDLAVRYGSASTVKLDEAGIVQMNVHVDDHGRVAEVRLLRSSGIRRLDASAIRAVEKWRFEPRIEKGLATSAWTQVNISMTAFEQGYCRIRDTPADAADGEEVHQAADAAPIDGAAMLADLLQQLGSDIAEEGLPLVGLLRDWGPVKSIDNAGGSGFQGWVRREILPGYATGYPGGSVLVRSDSYLMRHERAITRWRVESDPAGRIWCVHVGKVSGSS